jgi:hypothetical protein
MSVFMLRLLHVSVHVEVATCQCSCSCRQMISCGHEPNSAMRHRILQEYVLKGSSEG